MHIFKIKVLREFCKSPHIHMKFHGLNHSRLVYSCIAQLKSMFSHMLLKKVIKKNKVLHHKIALNNISYHKNLESKLLFKMITFNSLRYSLR